MDPLLVGLLILGASVFGYSWLGWRVLTTRGPARLAILAVAATVLCSFVLALRSGSAAGLGGAWRQQLPATVLVFAVFNAFGFSGASLALWRYHRTRAAGSHPYMLGVLGFVAGIGIPFAVVMAFDVVRVLGGEASQLSN